MLVTLLTDFGTRDYYVAAMKGVIATRAPDATIVDLGHDVPRFEIEAAAFFLLCCYAEYPTGTIHTVVVDPGVGSPRAGVAVRAGGYILVGPDNGVFSHLIEREGEGEFRAIEGPWLPRRRSTTFHGRDLFAPTAGALAAGMPFEEVGPLHRTPVHLPALTPSRDGSGRLRGRVLSIDRFGNIITSLTRPMLEDGAGLRIGDHLVTRLAPFYDAADEGEPFLIEGSAGFLEISLRKGSAATALAAQRGAEVTVMRLP